MTLTTAAPKGRRYSARTVIRACELREAGWSCAKIADFLSQELGVRPAPNTVLLWTDPKQAARQSVRVRIGHQRARRKRLTGRMPAVSNLSPEFKAIRARALRESGLSFNAIAKVMTFDFPQEPVDAQQIRYALRTGLWPNALEQLR